MTTTLAEPASATQLISNGGSGAGKGLDHLLDVLSKNRLDPGMNGIEHEGYGFFRFYGNFAGLSHVFNVRTSDMAVAQRLFQTMVDARGRPEYVSDVKYREAAARDYHAALQASGNERAYREARQEWAQTRPPVGAQIRGAIGPELLARLVGEEAPEARPAARKARP